MLYLIGTGLTAKDISLKSLEIIQRSKKVYLEIYTSKLKEQLKELEEIYKVKIHEASRNLLECTNEIINESINDEISLLIIGTPLLATTHTDLLIRAKEHNVSVNIIHNASIINVMGCYGLYSYSFGRIISIPYFEDNWKPTSFYNNIYNNKINNLHTLCLLDIRVSENEERFMTPNEALNQLMQCEEIERKGLIELNTEVFVICRFGTNEEAIYFGSIEEMLCKNFGKPLHSLIIPCKMDVLEREHVNILFNAKK
ncbi:diphthine synthase [Anncaliia algerae PRA339]|uniref:diphthine methyl ester synthase n=1 Tax=Anncaliia algerae PRA339 TaxID=1288291 RepID=A0A059F353_9MICR|nr:diphthine synthase [Anncaliia algerae PRA339]